MLQESYKIIVFLGGAKVKESYEYPEYPSRHEIERYVFEIGGDSAKVEKVYDLKY